MTADGLEKVELHLMDGVTWNSPDSTVNRWSAPHKEG